MRKKRETTLRDEYKKCWKFLNESKVYLILSTILFSISILVGILFPMFEEEILKIIQEMVLRFEGLNSFETIVTILGNNLQAALFAIVLGVIFGILPLIIAIFNGYLVGFIARYVIAEEGILVLWRLLPHGIFEIPAILISIAFGLKIGFELWRPLPEKILKKNFKESLRFFVFVIIPLLLIAAVIEGLLIFFVN